MKRLSLLLLAVLLISGCASPSVQTGETTAPAGSVSTPLISLSDTSLPFTSRFSSETVISLSDSQITVTGENADSVRMTDDIIYYEDRETYESGNPYGEGTSAERHSAGEAAAHTVVNITQPGAYRVTGTLSAGQIRVDLGKDADENPDAVVELILDNADLTCTVAPAILFRNVYECDGDRSADTATAEVDTSGAGANLILEGANTVNGSHVARIFKDDPDEKMLWKQDGAIYSYQSMNVYGPGSLLMTADNEGLDTEMHLTIHGGSISIRADNDGINTNEDGVSVTTINGGTLHILAGLGKEGDGIDSNGYLVINGGLVISSAHPASDAGLDSDLGSFIHGGTVIALGSCMDWAASDSRQVTMNLQFAQYQDGGTPIVVTREDGTVVFAYDPRQDELLEGSLRRYQGAVLSSPNLILGETYKVCTGGALTGAEKGGMYDVPTVTSYENGTQMQYTGTDVRMGRPGGDRPKGEQPFRDDRRPSPDDRMPPPDMDGKTSATPPENPDTQTSATPESGKKPGAFDGEHGNPGNGFPEDSGSADPSSLFFMQDTVNCFSGLTPVQ